MKSFALVASVAVVSFGLGLGITTGFAQGASQGSQTVGDFPDLEKGLLETRGCLGTRTAQLRDGKLVIFAWFENKAAVKRWYLSPMHQQAMKRFFPGSGNKEPLAGFNDAKAPIMMIASVTPGGKNAAGTRLAISQIAIEAYTPVPGGLALGGSFSPDKLDVKGLVRAPIGGGK